MHSIDSRYKMAVAGEYPSFKLNRHLPNFEIPVISVYSIYAVSETRTQNLMLEKPETRTQPIQSGLWTSPPVPANYSKECCNTILYCN
jgi:hypothetical protein